MLTLTKHRLYASGGGSIWRATVGSQEIATGPDKATATANAWAAIEDLAICSRNVIHAATAADGTVLTIREYATGQYEITLHRDAGRSSYETGGLKIDGVRVGVDAMLAHRVAQYNDAVRPHVRQHKPTLGGGPCVNCGLPADGTPCGAVGGSL